MPNGFTAPKNPNHHITITRCCGTEALLPISREGEHTLKGVCLLHLLSENIFSCIKKQLILCFDETKIDLKPLIILF